MCDGMDDCNDKSDETFCVDRGTPLPDRAGYDRQTVTATTAASSSSFGRDDAVTDRAIDDDDIQAQLPVIISFLYMTFCFFFQLENIGNGTLIVAVGHEVS